MQRLGTPELLDPLVDVGVAIGIEGALFPGRCSWTYLRDCVARGLVQFAGLFWGRSNELTEILLKTFDSL
jgi:hypothetical protein